MNTQVATFSFEIDEELYEKYRQILAENGENVNDDLERYITSVIEHGFPNKETISALQEVQEMKKYPERYKAYDNVEEMFREILEE